MNQNILERGGRVRREVQHSSKITSKYSRFIASVLATMMAFAGLTSFAPAAFAQPASITNVTFESTEVEDGTRQQINVDWAVDGRGQNPVTISIDLPEELQGRSDSFSLYDGGTEAGTCEVTGDRVDCVLNEEYVDTNPRLSGSFNFWVDVQLDNDEEVDHIFDFGSVQSTVTVTPGESSYCEDDCAFTGGWKWKGAWENTWNDDIDLVWDVTLPTGTRTGGQYAPYPVGSQVVINDLMDLDVYEIVGEPRLYEARSVSESADGRWRPDYVVVNQNEVPRTVSEDKRTVTFDVRAGLTADELPAEHEPLESGAYSVEWDVRVIGGLRSNTTYTNEAEFTVGNVEQDTVQGSFLRQGGGGGVISEDEGQFRLTKEVIGDADVESNLEFTVDYSIDGVAQDPIVLQGGETFESGTFAPQTTVQLSEITPADTAEYEWSTPAFVVNGKEQSEVELTFTGANLGTTTEIRLINEATPKEEPPVPELEVFKNDEGDDVHQVEAGEEDVTVTITNDGNEALENFDFTDTTESGQDVVWNQEDLAGLEGLVLEPGDSYTVNGTVEVAAGETHRDNVVINAEGVISGDPVEDEDPTTYEAAPTYAIGDYVWIDANRDGIQGDPEDGEYPLNGVTVVLYDGEGEELDRTTTGADGRYIFDDLPAGDYQVGFELTEEQAERYEFTTYNVEHDAEVDSNAGDNGRSVVFTLGPDNEFLTSNEDYEYGSVQASEGIDPTWDAGVVVIPVPEIQVDKNEAGDDAHQVTAGEHDVVVTITNDGNEALENFEFADTTEDGHEVVWNEEDLAGLEDLVLAPGDSYTVNGTVQVDAGTTHRDNAVVNATGVISGEPVEDDDPTTYEADPTYAIGDYVWIDSNRDGIQGDNEDPLVGVTVELYTVDDEGNASEDPVDSTTTDENGRYIFDNLEAGDYQVRFILTDEQADLYNFTSYTEGEDPTVDSNAGEDGRSATITLNSDNEFLTTDYEYNSVNASEGIDPTWDAGVQFIVQPEIQVDKNESGDDVHQVVAGEHGVQVTITNAGDEDLENFQLEDTTEDGHDVVWNEEDLAGLEDLVLAPGDSYTVNGTVQVDAGTTHRDNVVITANGVISGEPVEGEDPTTYEADPTYAIGDYVWVDENRDGIQDEGEDPLSGVTVVLYDGDGEEIDRTTTDDNGRYIFDNLPEGDYQVGFELTEEQQRLYNFTTYTEGDDPATDSNAGENGRSPVFTLGPDSPLVSDDDYEYFEVEASAGIDPTWDAGVVLKPYAIGDYVWIDANNDGLQDEDEEPLADVTVVLFDADGSEIDRTTTDENGRYIFDTLNAGEYRVRFILTDEQAEIYEFTDYRAGSDTEVDSNAGYSGFSATITLGPDNQFLTLNEDYAYGTVIAPFGIDPTWDAGVVLIPEDEPGDPTPTPTEPGEPTEPVDPTDPTEPVDPTDPTEPGDPTDPTVPVDPTDPSQPADPADPSTDTSGDREGVLSKTGANLALVFGALGLILLLTGGALYARHRKGNEV